jgi:small subunit ribosomal protein S20
LRNRVHSSTARTFVSSARLAIATADADEAAQAVRLAVSALDRAAQKGAIHPNNAARRKARLLKKYNAALAAAVVAAQPARGEPPARKRRGKKEEATQVGAGLGKPATKGPALSAAKGRRAAKEELAKKERRAAKEEPAKKERRGKKKEK